MQEALLKRFVAYIGIVQDNIAIHQGRSPTIQVEIDRDCRSVRLQPPRLPTPTGWDK